MTPEEQANDHFKQQEHANRQKLLQAQRDFMRNPKQVTPAMKYSFAVALSQQVGQGAAAARPQVVPTDPKHGGVDGGIVKVTACIDNGDGTFTNGQINIQATKCVIE